MQECVQSCTDGTLKLCSRNGIHRININVITFYVRRMLRSLCNGSCNSGVYLKAILGSKNKRGVKKDNMRGEHLNGDLMYESLYQATTIRFGQSE